MNFNEYYASVRDIETSDDLRFEPAYFWVPRERLPLCLTSVGNKNLKIVKVPESVKNGFGNTVPVIAIAETAFAGNINVTDIILPSGIESLPSGAFSGCLQLKNITIPKKIKVIREKTFERCLGLMNVYYEGTMEEWKKIKIVFEKHEIEFGDCIPGTPVCPILAERRVLIPGNEALYYANIHFRCELEKTAAAPTFRITMGKKDVTEFFRMKP